MTCGKSHRWRLHLYHIFLIYSAFPGGSVLISECIGSSASQARGGVTLSLCLQCELQISIMLLMGPGLPRSVKSGLLKSVSDRCHSVVRGLDLHLSLHQLLFAGQQQISALKHPWWMQRMGRWLGCAPGCQPQRSYLSAWGMWTSSSTAGPWFFTGAWSWPYFRKDYPIINLSPSPALFPPSKAKLAFARLNNRYVLLSIKIKPLCKFGEGERERG